MTSLGPDTHDLQEYVTVFVQRPGSSEITPEEYRWPVYSGFAGTKVIVTAVSTRISQYYILFESCIVFFNLLCTVMFASQARALGTFGMLGAEEVSSSRCRPPVKLDNIYKEHQH